ncbi:MAG: ComEC/Rec2 family competence protein [Acidimicrobiales bacterium]
MTPDEPGRAGPGRHPVGEATVAAMAAAAWVAATAARPLPGVATAAVAAGSAAAIRRGGRPRSVGLVAVVALVVSTLAVRADRAFVPVAAGAFSGPVTVLDDPRPDGVAATSLTVRLPDGRRVRLVAHGRSRDAVARLGPGHRARVDGRLRPFTSWGWARSRHLAGRLATDSVVPISGPGPATAMVEAVRGRVVAGADVLPRRARPLYLGLVVGDDRDQPVGQRARFRAAGLSHLLAVSGQNVAFVLAAARPALSRLGWRLSLAATVLLLIGFAVATRLEPSVLRATTTAGLATLAAATGPRPTGVRILGLAVIGLILVDPFLVRVIGFQLSVAASAGILVAGPVIRNRLAGWPASLADPLAVTLGAQLAVLPVLVGVFGPVSTASVPANLLAGPAAGFTMTWGLTAGVVAGVAPGPVATVLQTPARMALWWLDTVASVAARWPLPTVDTRSAVALTGVGVILAVTRGSAAGPVRWVRRARWTALATVAVWAVAAVPRPPDGPVTVASGVEWLPPVRAGDAGILVVGSDARADDVADWLLGHRVGALAVVVSEQGGGVGAATAAAVADTVRVGVLLAPPGHRIAAGRRVVVPVTVATGIGPLTVAPDGDRRLTVTGPDR